MQLTDIDGAIVNNSHHCELIVTIRRLNQEAKTEGFTRARRESGGDHD
jgi:hypothetical protein